jgi:hypothetical protein
MKYMLLAYTNRAGWDAANAEFLSTGKLPADVQAACDFYEGLIKELTETGEFVTTEGLADASHTRSLRKLDGEVVATDGPLAEAKEVLVSYAIVDCASHDRAMEIAARVVDAIGDPVEVRPVPDGPGVLEV